MRTYHLLAASMLLATACPAATLRTHNGLQMSCTLPATMGACRDRRQARLPPACPLWRDFGEPFPLATTK